MTKESVGELSKDELSKVELRRIVLDVNQHAERRTEAVDALCRSWYNSGYAAGVDDSRYDNWEDDLVRE